jgi:phosphoenolpyruvate carboxykinase (GTP)
LKTSVRAGLDFNVKELSNATSTGKADWLKELALHAELFKQLEHHLPKALLDTKAAIEKRLAG